MREYRIITEPFEYTALTGLEIRKQVNGHAEASVTMRIRDDRQEQYMGILSGQTWVKVMGAGSGEDGTDGVYTVLFHGVVTDFSFSHDGYETILWLKLASGSIQMDIEPHFRVFQNGDVPCAGIGRKITSTYPEGRAVYTEGEEDRTGGVLIQHMETDWEFLKRLAGRTGRYLVPDALKGTGYTVGLPGGIRRTPSMERIGIRMDMEEYLRKFLNGMPSLQPADMTELVVTDREVYQMGDSMLWHGKEYFIWRIHTEYDGAECIHTYYLRTKEGIRVLPEVHGGLAGCSFDAVVTAVEKDRVQVEIPGDEWKAADGKKWFPYATVYSSPDGTGWYCMPEPGDSVRLYVPEREEDSFVLSAVHRETDVSRQKPDYKSLKTKYGKEILFTPDSIILTNNSGMMVELNDSEGITVCSDKDIVIEAGDNLTISSQNASLLIAAQDTLQVKQGGTSMTLSGDISFTGGEFRIQ